MSNEYITRFEFELNFRLCMNVKFYSNMNLTQAQFTRAYLVGFFSITFPKYFVYLFTNKPEVKAGNGSKIKCGLILFQELFPRFKTWYSGMASRSENISVTNYTLLTKVKLRVKDSLSSNVMNYFFEI